MSLRASTWLASHDLRARWPRVLLAASVVAVLSGVAVTMELLARAREEAVSARVDAMGPPLSVAPLGTTAEALGRLDLGGRSLPPDTEHAVESVLGSSLRRVEARLVLAVHVAGRNVPFVGLRAVEAGGASPPGLVAGSEVGRWLPAGARVALGGDAFQVTHVAPEAGSIEDASLTVPLEVAQRLAGGAGVNELRVYLRAGVDVEEVGRRLRAAIPGAAVVLHDRGSVAGGEVQGSLATHRGAAYAMFAVVALLCLLIAAQLDAFERRVELATLSALGTPASAVVAVLVIRSVAAGALGATAGTVMAMAVAALQDPVGAAAWPRWWPVGGAAVASATVVALLASLGIGLAAAARDPVADLQEG